jgi:hypothetical protein
VRHLQLILISRHVALDFECALRDQSDLTLNTLQSATARRRQAVTSLLYIRHIIVQLVTLRRLPCAECCKWKLRIVTLCYLMALRSAVFLLLLSVNMDVDMDMDMVTFDVCRSLLYWTTVGCHLP